MLNRLYISLLLLIPILFWSIINPKNIPLWLAEIFPLFIGYLIIIKKNKTFPLTTFSYVVIFFGATVMLVGSHYGYSNVPLCEWVQNSFGFGRNNYDKIVHFFQGFIMTTLMRELIIRKEITTNAKWQNFFSISFATAFGAVWEIIEWFFVLIISNVGIKEPASGFLGSQNYYWDAQSDVFFAIIGAVIFILFFAKYHNKQIKYLENASMR